MTSYTMTFNRANAVVVRHFEHEAGLPVLSSLVAKQGFLVIPEGATNALGAVEEAMTVFTPYIISLQLRQSTDPVVDATGSSFGTGQANL